jgi:hypothetical protein
MVMRSLEVHLIESETDIDSLLNAGLLLPEQLAATDCYECDAEIGFIDPEFEAFVVVLDENDQDWTVCAECAGPIIDYVNTYFPPLLHNRYALSVDDADEDDMDFF